MAATRDLARSGSIRHLSVSPYTIPSERPESDGTLTWESTTLVVVEISAEGECGLGYTYAPIATAVLARDLLTPFVQGRDAMDVQESWEAMVRAVRNAGRPGVASCAVAAVDAALWDLKAGLLGLPLAALLGRARSAVPVYGSGGFTSLSNQELQEQLGRWAESGITAVKMKVGREPHRDAHRVALAREAIGPQIALFVDANGAYARKEALSQADGFAAQGVTWFEEPVSSDDLEGLRLLRDRCPPGMEIAAGEYGYDLPYFLRMLTASAVDVLQADATRCAGITGLLQAGTLCHAFEIPLSTHTAPALHLAPACALAAVRHIEYFHDHVRIERALFDGMPRLIEGRLAPDLSRPGHGLSFRRADAEKFAVR